MSGAHVVGPTARVSQDRTPLPALPAPARPLPQYVPLAAPAALAYCGHEH